MKSTVRVEVFPDDINGHVSLDQRQFVSLRTSVVVRPGDGWASPGQLALDILLMSDYLPSFQTRYVDGSGEIFSCTATLRPQLII